MNLNLELKHMFSMGWSSHILRDVKSTSLNTQHANDSLKTAAESLKASVRDGSYSRTALSSPDKIHSGFYT